MSLLSVLINNNGKYISDKELVSKYIRNSCNSRGKIKNNLIKKWAGQLKTFFRIRHTHGQQVHTKVLSITDD